MFGFQVGQYELKNTKIWIGAIRWAIELNVDFS